MSDNLVTSKAVIRINTKIVGNHSLCKYFAYREQYRTDRQSFGLLRGCIQSLVTIRFQLLQRKECLRYINKCCSQYNCSYFILVTKIFILSYHRCLILVAFYHQMFLKACSHMNVKSSGNIISIETFLSIQMVTNM